MKPPIDWLLQGPAFVRLRTYIDLLDYRPEDQAVISEYSEVLADPLIKDLITEVNDWENQPIIKRHNDAAHVLHKLTFLAGLGIKGEELQPAIQSIKSHQSTEGPFQIKIVIPRAFGGDDIPKWSWVATDAPLIVHALLKLGVRDKSVMKGAEYLRNRLEELDFYPCFASEDLGRFRGPGRKGDPCPYANLIMLRMMACIPKWIDSIQAQNAAEMLLNHWEVRGKKKFFLFGIGTDFAKPKVPRIWYDIIHYLDTLSLLPFVFSDPRFREVVELLKNKADPEGLYTSQSIWTKWKGFEFCQKKEPSRWLTFLVYRILHRISLR
jgi:hypothetical protein